MGMPIQDEMGGNPNALAALFAALDVSTDDPGHADAYFPPYGFDPYSQHMAPPYDMAPYTRDLRLPTAARTVMDSSHGRTVAYR